MEHVGRQVSVDPTAPVLVLDWSFFVFWRFFATKSWWARAHPEPTTEALMDNPEFVATFARTFAAAVEKLRKLYRAPPGNLIALMDAPRAELWRTLAFPAYKANRASTIEGAAFAVAETLQAAMGLQTVGQPGLEADDLAYLFKQRLLALGVTDLVLLTDDNDWGQLADERVRVLNRDQKDIGVRCGSLLQKCLCGDPGDNIPPAFARCGKATAERLAADPDALEAHLAKDPQARAGFERNRLLIDMACIPTERAQRFDEDVTFVTTR